MFCIRLFWLRLHFDSNLLLIHCKPSNNMNLRVWKYRFTVQWPFAWSFAILALGEYKACESVILLSMDMPPELTACFLCWAFSPLYSVRSKMIWFLPKVSYFHFLAKNWEMFWQFWPNIWTQMIQFRLTTTAAFVLTAWFGLWTLVETALSLSHSGYIPTARPGASATVL